MAALAVVVFDVSGDRRASSGEISKRVLPGAFLFESANEPLAQAVLIGRVEGNVFLCETVIAHECTVGFGDKHEAVVMSQREATWSTAGGAEAMQLCLFQGSFCGLGPGSVCQLLGEHFTRATVDDGHEGAPIVSPAVHRSNVGGPRWLGVSAMDLRC